MKLLTKKEIFEEIRDVVDTVENYIDSNDNDQFEGLLHMFDKIEEMQKHYDLHEAKDMNYTMEQIDFLAKAREITDFEDML